MSYSGSDKDYGDNQLEDKRVGSDLGAGRTSAPKVLTEVERLESLLQQEIKKEREMQGLVSYVMLYVETFGLGCGSLEFKKSLRTLWRRLTIPSLGDVFGMFPRLFHTYLCLLRVLMPRLSL